MPKSVLTGQLLYHWETRKTAIPTSLMKGHRAQPDVLHSHLAVPKQKVTGPRASQHSWARAETSPINPTAEKFQFFMARDGGTSSETGSSWDSLNPPWPTVCAEAPAPECEVGIAIRTVIAFTSGWSFPGALHVPQV